VRRPSCENGRSRGENSRPARRLPVGRRVEGDLAEWVNPAVVSASGFRAARWLAGQPGPPPSGTPAQPTSRLGARGEVEVDLAEAVGVAQVDRFATRAERERRRGLGTDEVRHVGQGLAAAEDAPEPRHRPRRTGYHRETAPAGRVEKGRLARCPRGVREGQPVGEQVEVETRRVGVEQLRRPRATARM